VKNNVVDISVGGSIILKIGRKLPEGVNQWLFLFVNTVMNVLVPCRVGDFGLNERQLASQEGLFSMLYRN
jgi:hypothetical protein